IGSPRVRGARAWALNPCVRPGPPVQRTTLRQGTSSHLKAKALSQPSALELGAWSFSGACPESFRGWRLELPTPVHPCPDALVPSTTISVLTELAIKHCSCARW